MAAGRKPGDRWVYEWCDRCDRRSTVAFEVTHEAWATVVGDAYHRVCTTCFDELADERDVEYVFVAIDVTSWSQGAHGEWPHLDVPCAECVGREKRRRQARRRQAI